MAFGFGGLLGGGPVPDVQMPDGLPVAGGKGSPLVDAFLALQAQRLQDAVTAPRDAYTGDLQVMGPDGHPTAEAMDRASGMAGLAMTGSMPFKAPAGALRTFGGAAEHDDPLAGLMSALHDVPAEAPRPGPRQLDPYAASWDLYHGSAPGQDFARFDPTKSANPAEQAVFFAPNPDTASGYAGSPKAGAEAGSRVFRATVEPGRTGVFDLTHLAETDAAFNARAREITIKNEGGAYGPVHDDYMSDFRARRAQEQDVARQAAEMGYTTTPDHTANVSFGYGHIGAAVERAKAQGLDTAILRGLGEHGGDDQVVALTPGRVRSFYDPSQVLYSGGPGAAAGLPALAAFSDPKGSPVSAGLQMPSLGDLSPEMQAQIMQMLQQGPQAQPQQAAPSPVDSLLFDRAGMGAPDNSFSGSSGTVVGAQPQQAQAAPAPAPQTTGALPKPPAVAPQDEAPAPAPAAASPPPARPSEMSALAGAGAPQVGAFDPLSGQPVSGSPKPLAPAAAAPSSGGFDLGDAFSRMNRSGLSDQLIAIAAGVLSGRGLSDGLGQGLSNALAVSQSAGKSELERLKLAKEQAALTGNAQILRRAYPNLSDAELGAMATNSANVTTALQILRDPTHGMPKSPEQMQAEAAATARGSMEGGAKPLDRIKGEAQAQAEGSAAGSPDNVQVITRPDNSIIGVNKSKIGEAGAVMPIAPGTAGARVWGTVGADGRMIEPPPGTPPGTPGAYDEKGMPHVALTQGTNQLPQKANAELDQAAVKAITESRAKAEGAIGTIAAINRQKEAIDRGIVSGAGADWRTQARAVAAQVLGIPDSYVTQSQLFDQAATQKSAELAKAISQSGHTTNMDLQLGKTISSGDRSSVEAALRAGIEAQEILAKKTIDHHNASVDRFATPETAQRAGFFKVEQPEVYQYRPAAPDRSAVEAEMRRRGMMR